MKALVTTDVINRLRQYIIIERDCRPLIEKLVESIGYQYLTDSDYSMMGFSTKYTSELLKKFREPLIKLQQAFPDYFSMDYYMQLMINMRFLKEANSILQELREYNEMVCRSAFAGPNFV